MVLGQLMTTNYLKTLLPALMNVINFLKLHGKLTVNLAVPNRWEQVALLIPKKNPEDVRKRYAML